VDREGYCSQPLLVPETVQLTGRQDPLPRHRYLAAGSALLDRPVLVQLKGVHNDLALLDFDQLCPVYKKAVSNTRARTCLYRPWCRTRTAPRRAP